MALECRCAAAALPAIRRQIANVLPDVHVIRDDSRAVARAKQRALVKQNHETIIARQEAALESTRQRRQKVQTLIESLANVMTPVVVFASAIWVGLLALSNVLQRKTEIGILRAIGKGSMTIAALFLGKAILLGVVGATLGLLIGGAVAHGLGMWLFRVAADGLQIPAAAVLASLFGAPLLSAVASYLPTLAALTQDPAVVLREQ